MKDELEDEVEFEIPVFLNKPDTGVFYILQYPTLSIDRSDLDEDIHEARLRPNCKQLEIERWMSDNSSIYDEDKGRQMAMEVDGPHREKKDDADNCFPSGKLDKMLMRSDTAMLQVDRYAVGCFKPGLGFTLAPLECIMPMTPALDYLDKADARKENEKKAMDDVEEGTNPEDATRTVTVRFERAENDRMRNARVNSYVHLQRTIQEEPWVTMQYKKLSTTAGQVKGFGESYGDHLKNRTFSAVDHERIDQFHLPPSHFLSLLTPPSSNHSTNYLTGTNEGPEPLDIPKTVVYSYPLEKQIEIIMKKVGVTRFSEMKSYLEDEVVRHLKDAELIVKIQSSATLVQGCWVIKSELLYPPEASEGGGGDSTAGIIRPPIITMPAKKRCLSKTQTEAGTSFAAMLQAREYALFLLHSNCGILERQVVAAEHPLLTGEDLLNLLKGIARPMLAEEGGRRGKWRFLLDRDDRFISNFNNVAQRYESKWNFFKSSLRKSTSSSGKAGSQQK